MDLARTQFYEGSRTFMFLSNMTGLPIDQINFLIGQIFALFLGYIFRTHFHASNTKKETRHWFAFIGGLTLSYFCFGKQLLFALFLVAVCYLMLDFLPSRIFHHVTLIFSVGFLSYVHICRQVFQDGAFVADITGPLMILIQKVTSLAYSLHDSDKKEEKLTELQKKFIVRKKPSFLEYFSYMMCFQSMLSGPYFMFSDYKDYIEGTYYLRYNALKMKSASLTNNNPEFVSKSTRECEPNPTMNSLKKVFLSLICAFCVIFIKPHFPHSAVSDPSFLDLSIVEKVLYCCLIGLLARPVYYCAWLFGDAVCVMSGLGFNGYDEIGNEKWDLITNCDIIGFEFSTSLKMSLDSWNIGTMKWLRFLVYERAKICPILCTYVLSAIWHGFYPGYYLTFLTGALFTYAARLVRRLLRPIAISHGENVKRMYDAATFLLTRICLGYLVFPFVILRFWSSIYIYLSMGCFLHVMSAIVILAIPPILRKIKKNKQS